MGQPGKSLRNKEKRLAPWALSCGTISLNEVFVGRHHRHGWSRRLTAHRVSHMGPDPAREVLWTGKRALVSFLVVAALFLCLAPNALAQAPIDDVHVTPRVEPPKADPAAG